MLVVTTVVSTACVDVVVPMPVICGVVVVTAGSTTCTVVVVLASCEVSGFMVLVEVVTLTSTVVSTEVDSGHAGYGYVPHHRHGLCTPSALQPVWSLAGSSQRSSQTYWLAGMLGNEHLATSVSCGHAGYGSFPHHRHAMCTPSALHPVCARPFSQVSSQKYRSEGVAGNEHFSDEGDDCRAATNKEAQSLTRQCVMAGTTGELMQCRYPSVPGLEA